MTEKKVPRLQVTAYLLKATRVAEATTFFKTLTGEDGTPLREGAGEGHFFALPSDAQDPPWLDQVSLLLATASPPLQAQFPSAVLLAKRGGRSFLLTFGQAHNRVKNDWIEPDFGKITAQAVLAGGQVREMRSEQVFGRQHTASERSPRGAGVRDFGFEPDRDMVGAVEGAVKFEHRPLLGAKVSGGQALRFELDVKKLPETLDLLIERFRSDDHKRNWPELNNLALIRDNDKLEALNLLLDAVLADPNAAAKVALSASAERTGDGQLPQHFIIGRKGKLPATAPYLMYGNWLAHLKKENLSPSVASAIGTTVHMLDGDKEDLGSCTMFDCFGIEVSDASGSFALSSGKWYQADPAFVQRTNQELAQVLAPKSGLCAWATNEDEGVYNQRACATDKTLWLFDKMDVHYGQSKSKFEFCDILHLPTKTLYFVKHPTRSASVSHLSEQLRRTAELFFGNDQTYRDALAKAIAKAGTSWDASWTSAKPRRDEWTLCLVSMGTPMNKLPFFAKCGLARLLRDLEQRNFKIAFLSV
ncbi:TIGR04141 family sporadically distributed protein [Roseateles sp.]|uniref:TIGR04141 family sporadically distributed protein n=1 Tax=Roseateles sp. TaxID=1971397 RepID=UPI00326736BB